MLCGFSREKTLSGTAIIPDSTIKRMYCDIGAAIYNLQGNKTTKEENHSPIRVKIVIFNQI